MIPVDTEPETTLWHSSYSGICSVVLVALTDDAACVRRAGKLEVCSRGELFATEHDAWLDKARRLRSHALASLTEAAEADARAEKLAQVQEAGL